MKLASLTAEGTARTDRRARPPRVQTSLIGRDEELATLIRLLRSSDASLTTITGRSGSGKTRLALEAAHRVASDLPGGAVIVSLGAVSDISMLGTAVAAALDLAIAPGQEPEATIARELQYVPTLILVDDIDDLPGAVDWFADLMAEASSSRLLATAKAPLRKSGERVVRVGPLRTHDKHTRSDDDILVVPSVQLFADRAAAVQYNFKLDRSNLRSVAELCRRLDGLPLAIELAAARSTTLSPSAQLRLLDRGSALDLGHEEGQLRQAIGFSYGLVGAREQLAFRRMSIFEGSASLDALGSVCAPETDQVEFLDDLMSLVDVHLVEADNTAEEPRFWLLPMIRDFAREKLRDSGEEHATRASHEDYFIAFARRSAALLEHEQVLALARERANLEMTLAQLLDADDTVRGARLAADLGLLWERYGWFPIAQHWVDELVAAGESDPGIDPETRALPLVWWVRLSVQHPAAAERAALVAERQKIGLVFARQSGRTDTILLALQAIYFSVLITHDYETAVAAAFEGLEIARAANDERWLTRFEIAAGIASNLSGDLATAATFAHSAMARAKGSGDLSGMIAPYFMLRDARARGQEVTGALPSNLDFLVLVRDLDEIRAEGWVLSGLTAEALDSGDQAAALRWATEGLELGRRTGLWDAAGFACRHLALLAAERGDDAAVARLHGTMVRITPVLEVAIRPDDVVAYHALIEQVRQRSGRATFDRLSAAAAALAWDDAILAILDYADRLAAQLVDSDAPEATTKILTGVVHPGDDTAKLTPRELQVLTLLATGATNNAIAEELGLSTKTVMHHSVSIYAKLNVRGRAEATAWAFRHGIVTGGVVHSSN